MNTLGDFQTPPALAALVVDALRVRGIEPARVLEPTCGSGAFLDAAAAAFPAADLIGIEYQRERYGAALCALERQHPRLSVHYANAYQTNFAGLPWRESGPLLIVGNPPWITAAALGRGETGVLQPPRSNPKRLRGLAARTGAANFDVAEFLILTLLNQLRAETVYLALLVKESVARNVVTACGPAGIGIRWAEIVRIDARSWFGVAVDACCLLLATAPQQVLIDPQAGLEQPVAIRPDFGAEPTGWFVPAPERRDPNPAFLFRQGIKHDAADVFELRQVAGVWRNGYGDTVDIEPAYLYPLVKASALHSGSVEPTALIVPQTRLGAASDALETRAPHLWRYLCDHAPRIAARKSSIYRNAPRFAMFGVGPYSFAPWKVAVAGFYAQPRFRVLGPQAGQPVVLGDTSYFVAFEDEADARAFATLCSSPAVGAAIAERIVRGKRPITKALLDSIDWPALALAPDPAPDRLRALVRESPVP